MQPAVRGVLIMFGVAALLIVNGALCLLTDFWYGGPIVGWVLFGIGVLMIALTLTSYLSIARWNSMRKAGWRSLEVRVLLDHARGEKDKTLVDTADGQWRIAMLNYPLELRDQVERNGRIEYLGELAHKKPILLRALGSDLEFVGYARAQSSLRESR